MFSTSIRAAREWKFVELFSHSQHHRQREQLNLSSDPHSTLCDAALFFHPCDDPAAFVFGQLANRPQLRPSHNSLCAYWRISCHIFVWDNLVSGMWKGWQQRCSTCPASASPGNYHAIRHIRIDALALRVKCGRETASAAAPGSARANREVIHEFLVVHFSWSGRDLGLMVGNSQKVSATSSRRPGKSLLHRHPIPATNHPAPR